MDTPKPVSLIWLLSTLALGCTVVTVARNRVTAPATPSLSEPTPAPATEATFSPSPPPPTSTWTPVSPEPTEPVATISQSGAEVRFELFEDLDLAPGQVAQLEGTGIQVMLVEAHGPPQDCSDCPNVATLIVSADGEDLELRFSFSGNMPFELLQKARRQSAFGYVFIAVRTDEDSFTIRVEPETE
jgi:hypothetical protein